MMLKSFFCISALVALALIPCSSIAQTGDILSSEEDRILYSLGVQLMLQLAPFQLNERELKMVHKGMNAAQTGRYALDPGAYQDKIHEFAEKRVKARAEAEAKKGKLFIETERKKKGAISSPSGLVMTISREGTGPKPQANSLVKVHYHGTLIDGMVFDSSRTRGEPATFPLNRVIPCWTDALTQLKVGSRARLVCPPEIAYGNAGAAPAIPPGATLIFDVELLSIEKAESPATPSSPK